MTQRKHLCAALFTLLLIGQFAFAGEISTISLKPYIGESPFDSVKADWLLPRGRHVFDGVPWQIDGCVLLYADSYLQREKPAPRTSKTFLLAKNSTSCTCSPPLKRSQEAPQPSPKSIFNTATARPQLSISVTTRTSAALRVDGTKPKSR